MSQSSLDPDPQRSLEFSSPDSPAGSPEPPSQRQVQTDVYVKPRPCLQCQRTDQGGERPKVSRRRGKKHLTNQSHVKSLTEEKGRGLGQSGRNFSFLLVATSRTRFAMAESSLVMASFYGAGVCSYRSGGGRSGRLAPDNRRGHCWAWDHLEFPSRPSYPRDKEQRPRRSLQSLGQVPLGHFETKPDRALRDFGASRITTVV